MDAVPCAGRPGRCSGEAGHAFSGRGLDDSAKTWVHDGHTHATREHTEWSGAAALAFRPRFGRTRPRQVPARCRQVRGARSGVGPMTESR